MAKGNTIHCYDYVNHPYQEVRDALTSDADTVFSNATRSASARARSVASELRVNIVGIELGTDVLISVKSSYNRDLQEDKLPLFDTVDTVRACVRLMSGMLRTARVNKPACLAAVSDPTLLATDLADYLVRKNRPFRHAHHAVGKLVALAERLQKPLNELSLDELRGVDPLFEEDARQLFDVRKAMTQRNLPGAPGNKEVARQLVRWRRKLAAFRPRKTLPDS
jgi:argininosuccinate lyase